MYNLKTNAPPANLSLIRRAGDKAQLYWGEVKLYLGCCGNANPPFYILLTLTSSSYLFFLRKVTMKYY
jgi:hypothetical protein